MKINNFNQFLLEDLFEDTTQAYNVSENVVDAVKTVIANKKIKRFGNKLKKLYVDKAKEEIVTKEDENPKNKERAKNKIETLNDKISVINDKIDTTAKNVTFMTKYIASRASIIKSDAKMSALELKSKHFDSADIDTQIKTLKDKQKKAIEVANTEKKKMSEKEKDATNKAKEDTKDTKVEDTEKKNKETNTKSDTPKKEVTSDDKATTEDGVKDIQREIDKLTKQKTELDSARGKSHITKTDYEKQLKPIEDKLAKAHKFLEAEKKKIKK